MQLTPREQRALRAIEQALTAEDPALAELLCKWPARWRARLLYWVTWAAIALAAILLVASLALSDAGLFLVALLIGPAFMALIIVIAVAPVQNWLRRHRWPGWATTLVVILLVYAIMFALALGIIISVARLATELPQYASKADSLVTSATAELAKLGIGPEQIAQAKK